LRIEYRAETRASLPERAAELAQGGQGTAVAVLNQAPNLFSGEFAAALACGGQAEADAAGIRKIIGDAQQCPPGAVLFEAAVRAAATGQPVGDDA